MLPMNDTEMMCERCNEVPAQTLVEHAECGEAVCHGCIRDEAAWYSEEHFNGQEQ